jgi:hypothetical protein
MTRSAIAADVIGGKGQNERKVSTFVACIPVKPLGGILIRVYRPEAPVAVPLATWVAWMLGSGKAPPNPRNWVTSVMLGGKRNRNAVLRLKRDIFVGDFRLGSHFIRVRGTLIHSATAGG